MSQYFTDHPRTSKGQMFISVKGTSLCYMYHAYSIHCEFYCYKNTQFLDEKIELSEILIVAPLRCFFMSPNIHHSDKNQSYRSYKYQCIYKIRSNSIKITFKIVCGNKILTTFKDCNSVPICEKLHLFQP